MFIQGCIFGAFTLFFIYLFIKDHPWFKYLVTAWKKLNAKYTSVGTIGGNTPINIMRADFGNIPEIIVSDDDYFLYRKFSYEDFLEIDQVDKRKPLQDIFDCDDYAAVLMGEVKDHIIGAPFGIALVQYSDIKGNTVSHMLNCFIDENKEFWFVEPQNDKIFKKPTDWVVCFIRI